jgi:hypothetical protein
MKYTYTIFYYTVFVFIIGDYPHTLPIYLSIRRLVGAELASISSVLSALALLLAITWHSTAAGVAAAFVLFGTNHPL